MGYEMRFAINRFAPPQKNSQAECRLCAYLSDPKEFLRLAKKHLLQKQGHGLCCRIDGGLFQSWAPFGVPVFLKSANPNFKAKVFFRSLPLISFKRQPPKHIGALKESRHRPARIYLNIGSLPFGDNCSGIPRVAKELTRQGLLQPDSHCLPVYADPRTGRYKIACAWISSCSLGVLLPEDLKERADDPEITVQTGDWLIHTMINANELEYESAYLASFRQQGGKVGSILHDIIAELHPEFFKRRDAKHFSRWLRMIPSFDAIFAISKCVRDEYLNWVKREGISSCPCRSFTLGADFRIPPTKPALSKVTVLDRVFFLKVSTIEPRKGHAQVLKAFESLWQAGVAVNLVFVGRQGWKTQWLCHRIRNHKEIGRRLFWFCGLSDNELLALYRQCRAVIMASEAEGFGLAIAEALHFGKEVIARDIPIFREVGGQGVHFFQGNERAIASVVSEVLKSPPVKASNTDQIASWSDSYTQMVKIIKESGCDKH